MAYKHFYIIQCQTLFIYICIYIYIYIYIYIIIHRQICFVPSELSSAARHISFPYLGSKPGWLKRQSKPRGASSSEVNFKRLWITITIVYIHPFNGYRDLNSYMKRLAINANGNTIPSFAGELNPTLYIYIYIYIYIYSIYIYIYTKYIWLVSAIVVCRWHYFLNRQEIICMHTDNLNHCYLVQIILSNYNNCPV